MRGWALCSGSKAVPQRQMIARSRRTISLSDAGAQKRRRASEGYSSLPGPQSDTSDLPEWNVPEPYNDESRPRRKSTDLYSDFEPIYNGAISTVYHATCRKTGRDVVLKAYHKDVMTERHYLRLEREILVQQAIQDVAAPLVCQLIESFEEESDIFLVLERCVGGDVFALQHEVGGALNESFVCTEVIEPLLRVLETLHSNNWIHRDIKPENIFLTGKDQFKLGDFGLSINFVDEHAFHISGTLDYLAPEMLRNPSNDLEEGLIPRDELAELEITPYGPSIDIWAVGIIAYELVAGSAPFTLCGDEQQTMRRILDWHDIAFPRALSPQWADFVRCALEKDPHDRPDATQLLQHPWVRKHTAARVRGDLPEPRPERALLCRHKLRQKPRTTSVESSGMRGGEGEARPPVQRRRKSAKGIAVTAQDAVMQWTQDFAHDMVERLYGRQAPRQRPKPVHAPQGEASVL